MSDDGGLERYVRDDLPRIVRLLNESRVTELELQGGSTRLRVRRPRKTVPNPVAGAVEVTPPDTVLVDEEEERGPEVDVIRAPVVGTYFHAEQPGRAPLINEGARVQRGTLVGVIEALQVMTEVESDTEGIVAKILVGDGVPVQYGQPLAEVSRDGHPPPR